MLQSDASTHWELEPFGVLLCVSECRAARRRRPEIAVLLQVRASESRPHAHPALALRIVARRAQRQREQAGSAAVSTRPSIL